ncbi:MAG: phosphatidylserine decarboxylase family protein [bacterium]|nr:MAG: phosphatidylserine decarboxylase family protein [bacterium]
MITKYGIGIVITSWIIFLVFLALSYYFRQPILIGLAIVSGLFSLFNLLFFRDPQRVIPQNPAAILSPADGKIVQVTEIEENEFFRDRVIRISIFLSVFDVHVNRSPITGKVEHFEYRRGDFRAAFKEDASLENEQTVIGIVDEKGRKVMFTQIAGLIARRIVCELREGYDTQAGQKIGMIRYGSRVDIYFEPEAVDIHIKTGDRVKGGESIIGEFK